VVSLPGSPDQKAHVQGKNRTLEQSPVVFHIIQAISEDYDQGVSTLAAFLPCGRMQERGKTRIFDTRCQACGEAHSRLLPEAERRRGYCLTLPITVVI
jgi:hypothetical protein